MGETQLPEAVRNADLAPVQVACEHKIEHAGRHLVDHVREVAEEDAKVGFGICESLRMRAPTPIRAWVDADDLHAAAAKLDNPRVVFEQHGLPELVEGGRLREWIATERE